MTIETILAERSITHGNFSDQAELAQRFKQIAMYNFNSSRPLTAVQREALSMILLKISRIIAGDPNHKDHWDDIAGYAKLVSERLP